jgi:hypothetical protein
MCSSWKAFIETVLSSEFWVLTDPILMKELNSAHSTQHYSSRPLTENICSLYTKSLNETQVIVPNSSSLRCITRLPWILSAWLNICPTICSNMEKNVSSYQIFVSVGWVLQIRSSVKNVQNTFSLFKFLRALPWNPLSFCKKRGKNSNKGT